MEEEKSNARKFIEAYNQIDYALRVQHDFKRSMGFSDMIRRAVAVNYLVRKYEDDLIDFGRLRNAIIHRSNEDYIIAEPHDDVVDKIVRIAKLITTPPKAIDSVCNRDVLSVEYNVTIKKVIELISKSSYSNIPVYKEGNLVGVANGQKILNNLGKVLLNKQKLDEYIENTPIENLVKDSLSSKNFEIVDCQSTIETVLDLFQNNRKLLAVLITKTGELNELPFGIITSTDVIEMNNILDNY